MRAAHLVFVFAGTVATVSTASAAEAPAVVQIAVDVPANLPLVHNVHELAPALLSGMDPGMELVVECSEEAGLGEQGLSVLRLTTPGKRLRSAMMLDGTMHFNPKTGRGARARDSMLLVPRGEAGASLRGSCTLPWVRLDWTVRYLAPIE